MVSLCLAVAINGVIGRGGALPWHIPEDLRRFKELTVNKKIIMGRRTYESMPKNLPEREYIIVSRGDSIDGVRVEPDLINLLSGYAPLDEEVVVIGGGQVARAAIPFCEKVYLTQIDQEFEGDTFFSSELLDKYFDLEECRHSSEGGIDYQFQTWRRKLRLVIFDMDGLMLDTEHISYRCWKKTAETMSLDLTDEFYFSIVGSNNVTSRLKFIDQFPDVDYEEFSKIRQRVIAEIYEAEEVQTKPGLFEILDFLTAHGIKKAVASSTRRERVLSQLEQVGVLSYMDYALCGDEITHGKPDPEIYQKVCASFECHPENAIVLEDSKLGLLSATSAGIRCILIPDVVKPDEESKSLAYRLLPSLLVAKEELIKEIHP